MKTLTLQKQLCDMIRSSSTIEEIKEFLDNNMSNMNIDNIEQAFITACSCETYNSFEVAKLIYNMNPTHAQTIISTHVDFPFREACETNNVELAKWLQSLCPEKYHIEMDEMEDGQLRIASYKIIYKTVCPVTKIKPLHEQLFKMINSDSFTNEQIKEFLDIHIVKLHNDSIERAFTEACCFGRLEVAKMIFSMKENAVDIVTAFHLTCLSGELEVAKWLYTIKSDFANDYVAFRWGCMHGQLEVAKWLYTINSEFVADYDAFRMACEYSNTAEDSNTALVTAEWIVSLFPEKYSIEIVDGKISSYEIKGEEKI